MQTGTIISIIIALIAVIMATINQFNKNNVKIAWNIILSIISGGYLLRIYYFIFHNGLYVWSLRDWNNPNSFYHIDIAIISEGLLCSIFSFCFFWFGLRLIISSIFHDKLENKILKFLCKDIERSARAVLRGVEIRKKIIPVESEMKSSIAGYVFSYTMSLITLIHAILCILIVGFPYKIVYLILVVLLLFTVFVPPFIRAFNREELNELANKQSDESTGTT